MPTRWTGSRSSLKQRGQLQPIRVRWDEADQHYVVVIGERRWRAAKLAGLESIACVVVPGTATPEEILEDQLVENCLREDLKPIEQARAYQSLMQRLGLSQRALAEKLTVSQGQIMQALKLLELPERDPGVDRRGQRFPRASATRSPRSPTPGSRSSWPRRSPAARLAATRYASGRSGRPRPKRWNCSLDDGAQVTVTIPGAGGRSRGGRREAPGGDQAGSGRDGTGAERRGLIDPRGRWPTTGYWGRGGEGRHIDPAEAAGSNGRRAPTWGGRSR